CRMAAYLAVANHLSGGKPGEVGILASIMLDCLAGRTRVALERIEKLDISSDEVGVWAKVLKIRATGDWRLTSKPLEAPLAEQLEYTHAYLSNFSGSRGSSFLIENMEKLEPMPDWTMAMLGDTSSFPGNHYSTQNAFLALFRDLRICLGIKSGKLDDAGRAKIAQALKVDTAIDAKSTKVISSALWSRFYQRHFLHYANRIEYFSDKVLGAYQQWESIANDIGSLYEEMELFPLGKLYFALEGKDHEPALREGLAFANQHPEWVTVGTWRQFEKGNFRFRQGIEVGWIKPFYQPVVPGGTALQGKQRLRPICGGYTAENARALIAADPFDPSIVYQASKLLFKDMGKSLYGDVLDYSVLALKSYTLNLSPDSPDRLPALEKLVALDPDEGRVLADHYLALGDEAGAARAYQMMVDSPTAATGAASICSWLVDYYMENNEVEKARTAAELGAAVYSSRGLSAASQFYARLGDGKKAIEQAMNKVQNYGLYDGEQLAAMVHRFPGDATEEQKGAAEDFMKRYFPGGFKKVTLSGFDKKSPPKRGVIVTDGSPLLRAAGVRDNAIIVALDGYRVVSDLGYNAIRELRNENDLNFIIFQDGDYEEVNAKSRRNRRMGFTVNEYVAD
ncbi:hypothetical protein OAF27_02940, partial [Verrucomicrobiales bacterium]|nr:hypothetical protein [Verrucomicrobiales bacterium]